MASSGTPINPDLPIAWLTSFQQVLCCNASAETLKLSALTGNLRTWTSLLTDAVVNSCASLGWLAAGKGHALTLLPQVGQEYLGIDVMAFASSGDGATRWPFPLAVFELENLRERAAYSLWKVLCVRAPLRVVFAYRNDWEQMRELVGDLTDEVIAGMPLQDRMALGGDVLLVTGSRGEGETFPYGYFKIWRLNANTGNFEKLPGWG